MAKLTQKEILTALLEGKKIRKYCWDDCYYIYLKDDIILNQDNWIVPIIEIGKDWEINIKPVSFFEALEALKDGKKVRQLDWKEGRYIHKGITTCLCSWILGEYLFSWEDTLAKWQILEGDENGIN